MTDLVNLQTGLIETVPEGEAEKAFLSGTHGLDNRKPTFLVDPKTNETYEFDATKAHDFLSRGFRFETDDERPMREYRQQLQAEGILGASKTFLKSAANQALLGVPELAADLTQSPEDIARRKIEEDENPTANIAGGLSGFGLSLAYGGPVWRGVGFAGDAAARGAAKVANALGANAAKSVAGRIGQAAAKGATEGIAVSVPTGLTEAVLGDHKTVSEAMLAAAGRAGEGAAIGAGASLVLSPLVKAAQLVGRGLSPEALERESRYFQVKGAGFRSPEMNKLEKVVGPELAAERKAAIAAGQAPKATTRDMVYEETGKFLDDLGSQRTLANIFQTTEDKANELAAGLQRVGAGLNKLRNDVDQIVPNALGEGSLIKQANDTILKYRNTQGQEMSSSFNDAQTLTNYITDQFNNMAKLKGGQRRMTLNEAHEVSKGIDEFVYAKDAFGRTMQEARSKGAEDIRALWRSKIDGVLTQIEKKYGSNPAFSKTLKDLNYEWGRMQRFSPLIKQAANRASANNKWGLIESVNAAGAGNLGGFPLALGAAALGMAKRSYGNNAASFALHQAAEMVDSVGKYVRGTLASSLVGKASRNIKPASVGFLVNYGADSETKDKRLAGFKKFTDNLATLEADVDSAASIYGHLTGELSQHQPNAQAAMQQALARGVNYLSQQAPKPPQAASPFALKDWSPSDKELALFERKVAAVTNPLSILDDLRDGTLSRDSVEAVKAVYPQLFSIMQEQLIAATAKVDKPIPYNVKAKAGFILGQPTRPSYAPEKIKMLQANYNNKPKPQPRANSKITEASRVDTEIGRVEYGQ